MTAPYTNLLLAYFRSENEEGGEQVRFAISRDSTPVSWDEINGGSPMLVSDIGERGVRDPFLIRDELRDLFVVIATDLRIWPSGDWERATHWGSRSIVVWESADLVTWTPPRLVEVAPSDAGNAWAPKAFWSDERDAWVIIFASARYPDKERVGFRHQRLMMVTTRDFTTVTAPEVYFDPGHDVIDANFLRDGDLWYRFSANTHGHDDSIGHHIFMERGAGLLDPYEPLVVDIGKDQMTHGEGPAVLRALDGAGWYLLIDDIDDRGYRLFRSSDLATGAWDPVPKAALPAGARHGSLIPITVDERRRLLE
jgi:hypothetical protein